VPDINIFIQDEGSKYDIASPAAAAGLEDGDEIVSFNGRKVIYPIDILVYSMESKEKEVSIVYRRDGVLKETTIKPVVIPETEIYKMGVYFKDGNGVFDPQISEVVPDSPAFNAGLKAGDKLVSIEKIPVSTRDDVSMALAQSGGETVKIKILRDGKEEDLFLTPETVVQEQTHYTGLYFKEGSGGFIQKAEASVRYFASIIKSVYYSITWLITGRVSLRDAMGPVGIISTIGSVVASKDSLSNIIKQLLSLMGLISVNLGLINLVPFPALDGSKLAILGVEAVTRRKIPIEKQAIISFVGFAILIIFLIAITSFDIMRLFGK